MFWNSPLLVLTWNRNGAGSFRMTLRWVAPHSISISKQLDEPMAMRLKTLYREDWLYYVEHWFSIYRFETACFQWRQYIHYHYVWVCWLANGFHSIGSRLMMTYSGVWDLCGLIPLILWRWIKCHVFFCFKNNVFLNIICCLVSIKHSCIHFKVAQLAFCICW